MNYLKIALGLMLLAGILISCKANSSENTTDISKEEAVALMKDTPDLQIIDVRTPAEWEGGVIDKAIKINIKDADFKSKIALLDKEAPVLVYCKSGGRSAKASAIMEELGFKTVYNLLGGYDGYSK